MDKTDMRGLLLPFLAVTLLGGALRLYGISSQPLVPDEIGAAVSASNYMEAGRFGPTMWYHPNLRNIVLFAMGTLFGYGPYSLRGISLLTGILSIPLAGALLYALTKNKAASLLAAFLLAAEQVHITFSRQAIQETWTVFFFLCGLLLAVLYEKRDKPLLLILSGIAFGLGVASKFHAIPPLIAALGALLYLSWKERSLPKGMFALSCLIALPAIIYLLTYIPWFSRGYDIAEWLRMQKVLFAKMMTHQGNPMDQVMDTQAWQWFLRPMGYANFTLFEGRPYVTVAFSNPLVWPAVLPAAAFSAWRLVKKKYSSVEDGRGVLFVLALFVISYAPLAFSPRPLWLLTSLAALPFAFMLVAIALSELSEAAAWGRKALAAYLVLVFTVSLALYPMAVGKAKHFTYLSALVERFRPPFEQGGMSNP